MLLEFTPSFVRSVTGEGVFAACLLFLFKEDNYNERQKNFGAYPDHAGFAGGHEHRVQPGAQPVSYTHLDVYKRQRLTPSCCASCWPEIYAPSAALSACKSA